MRAATASFLNPPAPPSPPMVKRLRYKAPPPLQDADAWLRECASGDIATIRASEVLEAFDHWRGDRKLSGELMKALLATIARRLRRQISRRFPHEGSDMIHAATLVIADALLDATSGKYRSIRKNFHHFVRFRALDQLAKYGYKLPADANGTHPAVPSICEYTDETLVGLCGASAADATDVVDVLRFLRAADTTTKAAVRMHFLEGDSLEDTAASLGIDRGTLTRSLQPMLDIRNERGGRGARA